MSTKSFTVIYRTGGTERFTWRRVFDSYRHYEDAKVIALDLERQGYPALIHPTRLLDAIGLPSTYEASL